MRESPMMEYSLEEFKERSAKAAEMMSNAGVDYIMGSSRAIVVHLTGLRSVAWKSKLSTPGLVFMDTKQKWGVVGSFSAVDTAMYTTCVDEEDFYFFDSSGRKGIAKNYLDALSYTLKKLGFTKGKIGCELSNGFHLHMDLSLYEALKSRFPDLEFVDASDLIWDILSVKSSHQIENLRIAERYNEQAVSSGIKTIVPGVTTEMDLYLATAKAGYMSGSEHFTYMSVLAGKERSICADCPPSETEIIPNIPGTIIRIEGGGVRRELNAPFTANIVVGKLSPEQETVWNFAKGMLAAGMAAVHNGVPAEAVPKAMDEYAKAEGRTAINSRPGYAGTGMGWNREDSPILCSGNETLLKAGMALSVVASIHDDSIGELILRQNVLVTETGCELLLHKTDEPISI